ncbi:hypothetical protein CANCADRAFT_57446 [Tortispora caseinolytica NRRL Y-17796]|uniref:Mitochondrial adapter protein MCP1 transmembrane domain-containing protein n=1 Tax=Tortispora caseinolytica NRRL Y-17796 TaxID=767744 RepID=A0A1E4TH56_9ASCO|nr:hypothetical protein CANCADRAFT_57446 [Tortispora caseinolytica NRRL Y-17796]
MSAELKPVMPDPIDEPIAENEDKAPEPKTINWQYYLYKIQCLSAFTFSGFTAMHLPAVLLAPSLTHSIDNGNAILRAGRAIYQFLPIEMLFAGSVILHVASGVSLRYLRNVDSKAKYGKSTKVSPIAKSGYLLAVLLGGHAFMVRAIPLLVDGDSSFVDLSYISHAISTKGAVTFGALAFLAVTYVFHATGGSLKFLHKKIGKKPLFAASVALVLATISLTVIAKAGPARGSLAAHYNSYVKFM